MSGISSVIVLDANGLQVYDSKDAVIVFRKRDPEEKNGAEVKSDPGKDKFISQVLDELGLGKEGKLEEFFYNMAEKIAELCYEVKQLKK